MIPFVEVLDRAHTGPIIEPKAWDVRMVPGKVKEKLREHGLEKTCDLDNPVNTDDGLADKFWKAGFELATELGMLCVDTKRVIKFSEDELKDVMRESPSEIALGRGEDRVIIRKRIPEDRTIPGTCFAAMGIEVSNDLFIPLVQSIAQYKVIDWISFSLPETIYGRKIRAGTPYETLAGKVETTMMREAMRRASRPNMPLNGIGTSATEYGQLGAFGIKDGPDVGVVLPITELKTSYSILHKTVHDVVNHEGINVGCHWSMIGGYVGPAEGAAVTAVAATLLIKAVHRLAMCSGNVFDIRYLGNTGRDAVWANSITQQAQNRNSRILTRGFISQVFGPCTHELLYETAAVAITDVVSGISYEIGTRPTGCKYPNYASGLENKFAAEVTKSSAGVKRSDANEIVKTLIPKYENRLQQPEKGKSFTECFNLKTLKPTEEWQGIYNRVWNELEDLGLRRSY